MVIAARKSKHALGFFNKYPTPVIVQETHYDPWGLELTGLGYQYGEVKVNKYLYNGKELIEDNGLQYYDYGARMYDATIGRWSVVDPLASEREWVSPYNYVQNNPLFRIDPNGMLDDYYNRDGQFLYRDNQETDNIRIIDQGDFDNIQRQFIGSMFDQNTYDNGLMEALGDKSVGINQAKLSGEAASNVFTDILGKMEGVDMGKLYNGKVSIDMGDPGYGPRVGFNDPEAVSGVANAGIKGVTNPFRGDAAIGTIKVTARFFGSKNSKLSTVSNVKNALGVHEYQGHGVKKFGMPGGGPHYKAYELQMNHPSWESTTKSFNSYMEGNYLRLKNQK